MQDKRNSRLGNIMRVLDISALELSQHSSVSDSLISRWRKQERPITARSKALVSLCDALVALDTDAALDELIAPYQTDENSKSETLRLYLIGEELPALPPRAEPPSLQRSGDYIAQQQVMLGERGFRKGTLLMLDYLMHLPPGRQVVVCAHNGFELWLNNVPFALQFLQKLARAAKRGVSFLLVNRRGFGMENNAHFTRFWLVAHLKGIIRSRYYDGAPPEEYFVAVIPGYWSGRVETDDTAEDGLISTLYTDPRNVRKDEAHCVKYIEKSAPASQYAFLKNPVGDEENKRGWTPGPLSGWSEPEAKAPDGCFSAICQVPSFGVMTRDEFETVLVRDRPPCIPDYLFREEAGFAEGPHRLILCREDVREGLLKTRRQNGPLSELLHRKAFVPREMLAAQLGRILRAMERSGDFEVALMPRSAFRKLELEIVCWHNSASVGWLQDLSESVFANDPITSGSFSAAVNHTWDKLHKGWRRRKDVMATLRKWLAGNGLDTQERDSAIVQNWDALSDYERLHRKP